MARMNEGKPGMGNNLKEKTVVTFVQGQLYVLCLFCLWWI